MKNTITKLALLTIALLITGCEDRPVVEDKKTEMSEYDKRVKEIADKKRQDDFDRAHRSRVVLQTISGGTYKELDAAMLSLVFGWRSQLYDMGYTDADLGVAHMDLMPMMLTNLISRPVIERLKQLVRDTKIVDNEVAVEAMVKLHTPYLLYTMLSAELDGVEKVYELKMPDIDLRNFNGRVLTFGLWKELNTEYNFRGHPVAMMKLSALCDKYNTSFSQLMQRFTEVNDNKNKDKTKDNLDVFGDVYTSGPYAYLGDTPKEQFYKKILIANEAVKYIRTSMRDTVSVYYPNY